MSQCVPSWDLDDNSNPPRLSFRPHSNPIAPDVPMLVYEVAELTWENGQLAMHSLGPPRVPAKPQTSNWEKPRASGTLESIVNQATALPNREPNLDGSGADELVPWVDGHRAAAAAAASATMTMTMDALVPCSNRTDDGSTHVMESVTGINGTCLVGCSTRVGSCSGAATQDEDVLLTGKSTKEARVVAAPECGSRDQSVSGGAFFGRDSQHVTVDTCERDLDVGFTSTSFGSPENTSSGKPFTKATTTDEHDSACHSRPQREAGDEDKKKGNGKSSVSTKRSRAAAIHNQSERVCSLVLCQ